MSAELPTERHWAKGRGKGRGKTGGQVCDCTGVCEHAKCVPRCDSVQRCVSAQVCEFVHMGACGHAQVCEFVHTAVHAEEYACVCTGTTVQSCVSVHWGVSLCTQVCT